MHSTIRHTHLIVFPLLPIVIRLSTAFSSPSVHALNNVHSSATRYYSSATFRMAASSSHVNNEDSTRANTTSNETREPPPTTSIHWGIIGLGDVCAIKSGPAFYKSHGSTLSAVMRRTPGKAREWIDDNIREGRFLKEMTVCGFESVKELMAWGAASTSSISRLDAIYVATPPGSHLEVVRQIVSCINDANTDNDNPPPIKAIYVEKPIGRSAHETRSIIEEITKHNIQFYPAYVSRAHERTQTIRKLLGVEGVCGEKITNITFVMRGSSFARGLDDNDNAGAVPWRLDATHSGGGLIMDMGCHILDRIDYLFGPIVNVRSTVLRKGGEGMESSNANYYPLVEDYVSMSAHIGPCDWSAIFSEGATVSCLWDFSPLEDTAAKTNDDVSNTNKSNNIANNDEDELIIQGTKGSLRMAGMGAGGPIEVLDENGVLARTIRFNPPEHAAQPLIQSVVNELRGVGQVADDGNDSAGLAKSPARMDNAIRTSKVMDEILNSYYGGRDDDFWLRSETWPGLK